jgi:hypothetical protein
MKRQVAVLAERQSINQFKDFDLFQCWTSLPVQDSAGGGTEEHAQRLRRACTRQRLPGVKELYNNLFFPSLKAGTHTRASNCSVTKVTIAGSSNNGTLHNDL